MPEDHPETTRSDADRDDAAVEVDHRIEKEQEHLPEGRPPGAAAERLSWRIAIWALALGALATLVTAYSSAGWTRCASACRRCCSIWRSERCPCSS